MSSPSPVSLVAVVVTYNRLAQLRVTLARLMAEDRAVLRAVVVVDNASRDGTPTWLAGAARAEVATAAGPELNVITNLENLGGAGGFERGMRHAVKVYDPDWLVVMDDDGRPAPGALARFQETAKEGIDAIAAAVYEPDGTICAMNRPMRNPFADAGGPAQRGGIGKRLRQVHLGPADYAGPGEDVQVATFVGLFVARTAIEKVGYPDGRLFIYGDDGIYTLTLSQSGGRLRFDPSVCFEHDPNTFDALDKGSNLDKSAEGQPRVAARSGRFHPLWKVYFYHRNLLLFYRQAGGWRFWPLLPLFVGKWMLKARAHPGERWAFLRLVALAVRDGLRRDLSRKRGEIEAWLNGSSAGRAP